MDHGFSLNACLLRLSYDISTVYSVWRSAVLSNTVASQINATKFGADGYYRTKSRWRPHVSSSIVLRHREGFPNSLP